jgi:SAM-dependent methyltransferase
VTGVDIAPTMVRLARRFNRFGPRCRYLVNRRPHLGCLDGEAFDLVYTNITLQHMEPRLSLGYVREFLRLLAPGGVAVFQLPADGGAGAVHAVAAAPTTRERLEARVLGRAVAEQAVMEMYPVPQAVVTEILHANGARLVDVGEDGEGGEGFRSCRYTVVLAH